MRWGDETGLVRFRRVVGRGASVTHDYVVVVESAFVISRVQHSRYERHDLCACFIDQTLKGGLT